MKLVAAVSLFVAGCTITIAPLPKHKPPPTYKKPHAPIIHHAAAKPSAKSATSSYRVVDDVWIEKYKKMEKEAQYEINADNDIEPLPDGRFKVPARVVDHYQDMLLTR